MVVRAAGETDLQPTFERVLREPLEAPPLRGDLDHRLKLRVVKVQVGVPPTDVWHAQNVVTTGERCMQLVNGIPVGVSVGTVVRSVCDWIGGSVRR